MNDKDLIPAPGKGVTSSDLFGCLGEPRTFQDQCDADQVAWDFIQERARAAAKDHPSVDVESNNFDQRDGRINVVWVDNRLDAVSVVVRSVYNRSVVVLFGALPNPELRVTAPTQSPQERLSND